jgi:uncharacterized membrane protein
MTDEYSGVKNRVHCSLFIVHSLPLRHNTEDVAQSVRAPDCGSGGRGFETRLSPSKKALSKNRAFFTPLRFAFQPFYPATYVMPDRFYRPVLTLLILAYVAGIIGLQMPSLAPLFRSLVPYNLLGSLLLLLLFHPDWKPSFIFYCILAIKLGFLIEVLGVHTGSVFGHYVYGETLGWKLWDVPVVIGLNWLMLTYCCGVICERLPVRVYIKTILAASLMILLDILIEPVAVRLDFWNWLGAAVPIRNYLGWWIVSLVLLAIWYGLPFRKQNRLALPLLILQFLFFVTNYLLFFLTKS